MVNAHPDTSHAETPLNPVSRLRQYTGETQEAMAATLSRTGYSVSRSQVANWELGRSGVGPQNLRSLFTAYRQEIGEAGLTQLDFALMGVPPDARRGGR